MKFELTLGEILQSATFLVSAAVVYFRLGDRVTRVETKLDILYDQFMERLGEGK